MAGAALGTSSSDQPCRLNTTQLKKLKHDAAAAAEDRVLASSYHPMHL